MSVAPEYEAGATMNADGPRLAFSPVEVAAALGISRELVTDLIRTGRLKSVKAGRRRLISRKHLDEFLAGDTDCPECQATTDTHPTRIALAPPLR